MGMSLTLRGLAPRKSTTEHVGIDASIAHMARYGEGQPPSGNTAADRSDRPAPIVAFTSLVAASTRSITS